MSLNSKPFKVLIVSSDSQFRRLVKKTFKLLQKEKTIDEYECSQHINILKFLEESEVQEMYDIVIALFKPKDFPTKFNPLIFDNESNKTSFSPKILLIAQELESYFLKPLFKKFNPDGFISFHNEEIKEITDHVRNLLAGHLNYSCDVLQMFRSEFVLNIDQKDRDIMFFLNRGLNIKEIPVPLSIPTKEKRMKELASNLGMKKYDREELITLCIERRII